MPGSRTVAEGRDYAANNLNQYTAIDDFVPQYDADGNQTLIKTESGIWSVLYNAENRSIRWQSGDTVITMAFDRMGRRVEMRTQSADSDLLQRFAYDNYLCVQQLRGTENILFQSYVWDPTEPIATRPLVFLPTSGENAYYFHDGNKNVSDLVSFSASPIHYDYTPFGSLFASAPFGSPFGFSSEMYDEVLNLIYYNHRHYNLNDGRWLGRDSMEEDGGINLFSFLANNPLSNIDHLGEAFFALRPLENIPWLGPPSNNPLDDYFNTEIAHEQLFFEDGKEPSSIGFFADNGGSLKSEPFTDKYRVTKTGFNDCVMRKALEYVDLPPYSLLGWGEKQKFNCQDFAETLREIYNILIQSECIRDCCGL